MVLYGLVWSRMVPCGLVWSCTVPPALVWSSIVPYVPEWSQMVPYGPLWSRLVPFGPVWSSCDIRQLQELAWDNTHSIRKLEKNTKVLNITIYHNIAKDDTRFLLLESILYHRLASSFCNKLYPCLKKIKKIYSDGHNSGLGRFAALVHDYIPQE